MKKIFAIALALVMVLSMASAFASYCTAGFDWTCATTDTNCGTATVEVVPYVKTNAACNGSAFVQSDCAAVVKGEKVYFGVKVVFDENVNKQWYEDNGTNLDITFSKLVTADGGTTAVADRTDKSIVVTGKDYKAVSGKTFWYDFVADTLVEEFSNDCVGWGYAGSTGVKVCANVDFDEDGKNFPVDLGKYTAKYDTTKGAIYVEDNATKDYAWFDVSTGKLMAIEVAGNKIYNAYANGKFYGAKYTKGTTLADSSAELIADGEACSYLPAMMQFLGLEFGDCVTEEGIQNFFGWKDDEAFKACATWSKNASSIVDAECVVAIPKTGDASVLAWLF